LKKDTKQELSETLEKGLRILDLFDSYHQGLRLTDISKTLGINRTSVYRYVNTFCQLGYLRKDTKTKLLKLGPKSTALAYNVLQNSDLVSIIRPVVNQTYEKYDIQIDVGLLHGNEIFLAYRQLSKNTRSFRHFTFAKGLHFLATGKAAMAFLPDEERDLLIASLNLEQKTSQTITTKAQLHVDLKKTRERGYSLNNEELVPGLIAIGAPIFSSNSNLVIGAVSFDSSTTGYTMKEFEKTFARKAIELAKEISVVLQIL